jgi:hypothetical protein
MLWLDRCNCQFAESVAASAAASSLLFVDLSWFLQLEFLHDF